MGIDRGIGWGRFVVEHGLYCLPTGRRRELTENCLGNIRLIVRGRYQKTLNRARVGISA
jgi:hypothetical protein